MGVEEIQAEIASFRAKYDMYSEAGEEDRAEKYGREMQRAERRLVKEEAKLPVHPAYVVFLFSSLLFARPPSFFLSMPSLSCSSCYLSFF